MHHTSVKLCTQLWVALQFRAIIQLCCVQGTKQTRNMDHVQFYLAWYLMLYLNLVNPNLAFFFLSLHLPGSISPVFLQLCRSYYINKMQG